MVLKHCSIAASDGSGGRRPLTADFGNAAPASSAWTPGGTPSSLGFLMWAVEGQAGRSAGLSRRQLCGWPSTRKAPSTLAWPANMWHMASCKAPPGLALRTEAYGGKPGHPSPHVEPSCPSRLRVIWMPKELQVALQEAGNRPWPRHPIVPGCRPHPPSSEALPGGDGGRSGRARQ